MAFYESAQRDGSLLRQSTVWLYFILGLSVTAFIWLGLMPEPAMGGIMTALVWLMVLTGLMSRLRNRRLQGELAEARAFQDAVASHRASESTESETGIPMRHVSAWLVGVMGLVATIAVWQTNVFIAVLGEHSILVVGAAVSFMLALAVGANAVNRLKTRRLIRDYRAARQNEQFAVDTLRSLDVMISACLPSGERTEFNDRFLEHIGRTFDEMKGTGWLDAVHPDDRDNVVDMVARPMASDETRREHDYCMQDSSGNYLWLRESLVPQYDKKGRLTEFICTAIDITAQVNNETALDEQINKITAQLEEARSELSKTKTSRNRFQKNLEEAREEIKNLQSALDEAEGSISEIEHEAEERVAKAEEDAEQRIESIEANAEGKVARLEQAVKEARQECSRAKKENTKLSKGFEKLQEEMHELRQQDADLREQVARHVKEAREAKSETESTRKKESQHRAKSNRLTQTNQELEEQLEARDAELDELRAEIERLGGQVTEDAMRREKDVSAAELASQLRQQLDSMAGQTEQLVSAAFDGPQGDAISNTAAGVRAMSALVDQALGRSSDASAFATNVRSFDLRATMQGVREMLEGRASERGVQLSVEVAQSVPGLVHADDIEIRSALMSLTAAALQLADDGTMTARLSEDVSTAAHSTIRCEISHPGAKVKADAVEAMLAMKATDEAMPNAVKQPVQHQAAQAWRTIRRLEGNHGFLLPDEGGFSIWLTFTVGRVQASAGFQAEPSAPTAPAPAAHAPASPSTASTPAPAMPAAVPTMRAEVVGDERKRHAPRMPQEFLKCNIGDVIELGGDGMRVHSPRAVKKKQLTISFDDVDDLELTADVEWSKKLGGRKHDVGLSFVGLMPAQRKQILQIAMQHRKVTTMLDLD